jgi:type I restriction enzyme S subunit
MTPEIKKRIEQVRHGEVPEGYKRGKLGVVPQEWNEIPFSTLFSSSSNYTDDFAEYPLYSLTIEDGVTAKTERYERSHLVKKNDAFKIVQPNEYAYNPMNIRFGAVARHKGTVPVAVSGYYDIFSVTHPSDIPFMDNFLTCDAMITYYNKVSTGSLVEKQRVHFSQFFDFVLPLPAVDERAKIAAILTTQDKVIELQQRKIEEIKKLKKVCLSKMFPRKGKVVPEARFPGFTDAWEQRKLGEIADIVGGGTPSTGNQSYWDGEIDWYAPAEIADQIYVNSSQKKITDLGYENSSAKMLPPGTVLFTSRAGIGKTAILTRKGCTNQGFQSIVPHRGELDSYFIFSRTEELKRYGELVGAGSTFVEVSGKQMAAMELMMPSTMREQQTIGGFFRRLDNLITLHQRKLEEMQKYKKALMQILLTGIVRVNT